MNNDNELTGQSRPERLHNKRIGRELAMQYLFQCSLTGEKFSAASWNAFIEQASEEHHISPNRYGRKCREYAEKLVASGAAYYCFCEKNEEEVENSEEKTFIEGCPGHCSNLSEEEIAEKLAKNTLNFSVKR